MGADDGDGVGQGNAVDVLQKICAVIETLIDDNERLRKALGWYVGRSAESLMMDGGKRASRALSGEDIDE